jgi:hypothetical protein
VSSANNFFIFILILNILMVGGVEKYIMEIAGVEMS